MSPAVIQADSDSDSASTAQAILLHNFFHMLAISILYWDHLLTLQDEIKCLWRRPKTQSAYWFFLNRYVAFLGNITVTVLLFTTLKPSVRKPLSNTILSECSTYLPPVIYSMINTTSSAQSCKQYNLYRQVFLVVQQVIVCILLTLRIYALYGRSLKILAFMIGSGGALATLALWSLFGQKNSPSQSSGCHIALEFSTAVHLAAAWEALGAYDSILLSFTLYRTYKARRHHPTGETLDIPLLSLVLRDGAIYFAVMALANLSNILTFYLAGPLLRGSLSTFASCVSVTMMSRLMLNLHQSARIGIFSTVVTFDSPMMFYSRTEDETDTYQIDVSS